MEQLKFETTSAMKGQPRLRVSQEAEEKIISIANATGLSKAHIATEMINFAFKYVEIIDSKEEIKKKFGNVTIIINNEDGED